MSVQQRTLRYSTKIVTAALLAGLILSGCSSGLVTRGRGESRLWIPAGVDSAVAVRADSMADGLFVTLDRESRSESYKALGRRKVSQSDTLWNALTADLGPGYAVTERDSLRAIEAFNEGARSLQELAQLEQSGATVQTSRVQHLLSEAQMSFERAITLNPFDLETKSWLARVYQTLAARFLDENDHKKAIRVLESLTRIERGEHSLFARLAEAHYAVQEWALAYESFVQAELVQQNAAGLDFSDAPDGFQEVALDSATLFYYVYYQGDTQIKLHNSEGGLNDLRRALSFATTARERADIQSYIEWINWDDGNTRAVELRDKFIAMQDQGEYGEAANGFRKLIPVLHTRRAIDEIAWRLAVLEFQFLDRQDAGIDRLKHVVSLAQKDANGAPVDTTYRKYFNSYGIMCHNLGLENVRKNRKFAFMYFQQAVAVDWQSRAKSHLEIAKLSRNNPKSALTACEGALAHPEQLDQQEQMQAYQLMVEALKRNGRFDEARKYYAAWMQLRNGSRRAGR